MFNIEGSLLSNFTYLFFQETVAYYLHWNDLGKVKVNGKNYKLLSQKSIWKKYNQQPSIFN